MTAPAPFTQQLLRRKPTAQLLGHSHGGTHSGPDLQRTIRTFQLTMFGVGRRHSALNIPGPGLHDLMTKDRELP